MWKYEKRLQFPVNIKNPNATLAQAIMSQYGGPDGELGASMRYLSQRYSMPYREVAAILTAIKHHIKFIAIHLSFIKHAWQRSKKTLHFFNSISIDERPRFSHHRNNVTYCHYYIYIDLTFILHLSHCSAYETTPFASLYIIRSFCHFTHAKLGKIKSPSHKFTYICHIHHHIY